MRKRKRIAVKFFKGFTLIELLVVIAILAVLLGIVVLAVNPFEQFAQAKDVATQTAQKDYADSAKYFYATEKTTPWKKDQNCLQELSGKSKVSDMPSCINELSGGGTIQNKSINSEEAKNIYLTQCNDSLAFCHQATSRAFKNNAEARYDKNGAFKQGCPGGDDCYLCNFTANESQECFQAMQPNTDLAKATDNPDKILAIVPRDSKNVCNKPTSGQASCMADVVTDSQGNPLSTFAPPGGFTPEHLHKAYNLPCTPGGTVNGKCTTPTSFGPEIVAVILAFHSPTIEQDLAVYSSTYGLPPCTTTNGCLSIVNQNGTSSPLPTGQNSAWAMEESLDVEMAHAICQTCKVLLVEADSNSFLNLGIATKTAGNLGATVISNSYGGAEGSYASAYDQYYDQPGVGVTAATGDWGYGAYYPAASNKVIAVSGTALSIYSDFSYAGESVWNLTGSGCSGYHNALSIQTSLSNWSQTGCGTKRAIGDVSADASPSTGAAIYTSSNYYGRSGWWIVGGTSLSSPLYAGVLALQGGVPKGVDGVTIPYQTKDKFRDVTSGSNGSCGNSSCTAGVGYDGPTGLGSPNLLPPSNVSPLPTSIINPTPTPTTPAFTPGPCSMQHTVTLKSTPILAIPGATVANTLSIKNNNTGNCDPVEYGISREYLPGWVQNGIQNFYTIATGETKNIDFTMTLPTSGLVVQDYLYQFWVSATSTTGTANWVPAVGPINGIIQVTQASPTNQPTPIPTPINYKLDDTKLLATYAMFTFPDPISVTIDNWLIDVSFRSDFGGVISNQAYNPYLYYVPDNGDTILNAAAGGQRNYCFGTSVSPIYSICRSYTSKYVAFMSQPYLWKSYIDGCGKTLYWRIVSYDRTQIGPTYSNTIDCSTTVGVVDPPLSWYTVFDAVNQVQKQYDASWDEDKNGIIDYTDYFLMAMKTKARAGGWVPPEILSSQSGDGQNLTPTPTGGVDSGMTPTPVPTGAISPTPTSVPTATPPPAQNCSTQQTVSLTPITPVLALPGDTVNFTITVLSNDSQGCSSSYTISQGFPMGWTISGVPASFTLAGGATKTIYASVTISPSAPAETDTIQFWVAKQGQTTVNPVNGYVQVQQVGPTNTPTPTPISCAQGWSQSLGSTSLSGNAGDTLNETITITNNNPPSCGSAVFGISYSYPTGWVINGLMPPSVSLNGGETKTLPISITISTGALIQDYSLQFWVDNGSNNMNATVHVLGTSQPPVQQMFSNFNPKMYGSYALLEYSYNATGAVGTRLDVATDPSLLNQTSGSSPNARYGFAYSSGSAMDASNKPTPSTVEGFISSSPQSWSGWKCGATIYYRMYNSGDLRIASPIESGVVDCTTVIDVLPWSPWYSAIYQGVYDARYDADNNGIIDYTDYWILVRATRLR